jgi:hypothetical protein
MHTALVPSHRTRLSHLAHRPLPQLPTVAMPRRMAACFLLTAWRQVSPHGGQPHPPRGANTQSLSVLQARVSLTGSDGGGEPLEVAPTQAAWGRYPALNASSWLPKTAVQCVQP